MRSVADQIVDWLISKQLCQSMASGFVVGVSGGVDSALVSTLCAMTKTKTVLLEMPIHRKESAIPERSKRHCDWLAKNYKNVEVFKRDLSNVYDAFFKTDPSMPQLTTANLRSRIRMCCLYTVSNNYNLLVAGTGNACEDMGLGFFSKYGDGGVDISPIGDLMKSEVRALARYLGVADDIVDAIPTDELWDDTRSDEDQIGATYDELEWAMKWCEGLPGIHTMEMLDQRFSIYEEGLSTRRKEVLKIYMKRHTDNAHKMQMPPICRIER